MYRGATELSLDTPPPSARAKPARDRPRKLYESRDLYLKIAPRGTNGHAMRRRLPLRHARASARLRFRSEDLATDLRAEFPDSCRPAAAARSPPGPSPDLGASVTHAASPARHLLLNEERQ